MEFAPLSYLSPKAAVRESPIHGLGLFAVEPFRAGEIVCVKGGHIFARAALKAVESALGAAEIQIGEDLFIGPVNTAERQSSMIFSNHSCNPNIAVQGQIVFVALREIGTGEELTHDWATTDDDEYQMNCRCGAVDCRGTITGKDWQKPEPQQKYRGFFRGICKKRSKPCLCDDDCLF